MDRVTDGVPVVLSVVIGAIVIGPALADPSLLRVPLPVWSALFVVYLVSLTITTVFADRVPWPIVGVAFGVVCVAALAVVVTAPGAGWIMITLVF